MNRLKRRYETKIERIMRAELEKRNLVFECYYPVRSGFELDFAFPDHKLGIECDGDRWHYPSNKKDRFRDYILKRGGWQILRFKEDQILKSIVFCVDKIEWCLNKRGGGSVRKSMG